LTLFEKRGNLVRLRAIGLVRYVIDRTQRASL
jgi:hypothetical protein